MSKMTNNKSTPIKKDLKKNSVGKKGGSSAMMTGAAGAVIGAAVGGVAGVALSDQRTRKKIGELAQEAKKLASETLEENKVEIPSKVELPTQKTTTRSTSRKN